MTQNISSRITYLAGFLVLHRAREISLSSIRFTYTKHEVTKKYSLESRGTNWDCHQHHPQVDKVLSSRPTEGDDSHATPAIEGIKSNLCSTLDLSRLPHSTK